MAPAQKLGQDLLCEGGKRGEEGKRKERNRKERKRKERKRKEGDLAWVTCVARVAEKRLSEQSYKKAKGRFLKKKSSGHVRANLMVCQQSLNPCPYNWLFCR